ncbi:MAG TPA: hypothetical protein VGL61_18505 [Kofleriaceae bacterium]
MADDAGALLVRSGLVSSSALDEARSKATDLGGTVGEQLVAAGQVTDDALTAFYKQRLLVPQVHPNILARLPAKVVAVIPTDMAIELRAIPVSIDAENNLTIAMSDPSDRHAVDRIAVFTGSYIVRAVATQMQIAWCLAHYYGHVTDLGARLMQPTPAAPNADETTPPTPRQRLRGITAEVDAMRHKGIVPGEAAIAGEPEPAESAAPEVTSEAADRARSVSGEIRMHRRAPSIKPPLPDDDSGPVIVMEADTPPRGVVVPGINEDTAPSRPAPPRRRLPAEPDPPELAARAGEVALPARDAPEIQADAPSVVIDDSFEREAAPPPPPPVDEPVRGTPLREMSGEIVVREVVDADSAPVMIRDAPKHVDDEPSAPILLDRKRPSDELTPQQRPPTAVVVKGPRAIGERRTSVGLGAAGAKRAMRDTSVEDLPAILDDEVTGEHVIDADPTRLELRAAPPGDDVSSDEHLAAPPSPMHDDDTSPVVGPPAPARAPAASGQIRMTGVIPRLDDDDEHDDDDDDVDDVDDDDDDDDDDVEHDVTADERQDKRGAHPTMVMSTIELDEMIPDRSAEIVPAHLEVVADDEDVDDGWGPPGTTIPPPLLGAIPGNEDAPLGLIPLPDLERQPLLVSPASPPDHARPHTQTEVGVARMLEQATMRVLELIQRLELATDRDEVVATMIAHLADTHRRAGFFAVRAGELSLFAIVPRLAAMPAATLRLDRTSTLADVVATRLPYRGPMHDAASRTFLQSVLGACPAEILLVPIVVRDRVVGVLFGEHRLRHTFDDQLALAGRAAGNALERILKSKRG